MIPGTFAWKDGTIKPNAGSYDAEWTFTPAEGYEEYAPATGTVTVTVEPAELTGVSVRAPSTYYTGKPQHASTIAFGQSVDGTTVTFTYSDKVDGDLYFGRTDFHRRRHVHRLLQSGSSKPQNGYRYVHRNHCPAADQPSLRRKNLQVLRRHRKRHAYRKQADVLQQDGQSFGHYTSRYGAHLL